MSNKDEHLVAHSSDNTITTMKAIFAKISLNLVHLRNDLKHYIIHNEFDFKGKIKFFQVFCCLDTIQKDSIF